MDARTNEYLVVVSLMLLNIE